MLLVKNRQSHRKLRRGLLVGVLTLAMMSTGVLYTNTNFQVHAQTQGVWGVDEDGDTIYTDANGWVFQVDNKTADSCVLLSVPENVTGELLIPSKVRLDSVIRTVQLSYYFVIPAGVTKVSLPKNSDEFYDWFNNFDSDESPSLTVCYYEGDEVAQYLEDYSFKTEFMNPSQADVIGGEPEDNWTYHTEKKKFIYASEDGLSYILDSKDAEKCTLLSISEQAQGEITIPKEVTMDGTTKAVQWIEDTCQIPKGVTKVTIATDAFIGSSHSLFKQCNSDLIVSFVLNAKTSSLYNEIKNAGLQMEFQNGVKDSKGLIYYWEESEKGKEFATMYDYEGTATTITIPSKVTINGISYNVTKVGMSAFEGNKKLKNVTLPNTITNIDSCAFSGCTSLKTIQLPSRLTNIGWGVFSNCSSLTSIKFPSGIKYLPTDLFSNCKKLKKIELTKDVTGIGDYVFMGCTSLTTIKNLNNVKSIGSDTFNGCKKLTSITLPKLTLTGYSPFFNCTALKSVTLGSKSIEYIGEGTFNGAKNLKTLIIKATNLSTKNLGANFLKNTNKKLVIKVPAKKVKAYKKLLKKYGNKTVTVKKY